MKEQMTLAQFKALHHPKKKAPTKSKSGKEQLSIEISAEAFGLQAVTINKLADYVEYDEAHNSIYFSIKGRKFNLSIKEL